MNNVDNNIATIPKLLRAIGNTRTSKLNKHDVIFNEAANLIEHLAKIREKAKQIVEEQ